jgi:hypothetical protein
LSRRQSIVEASHEEEIIDSAAYDRLEQHFESDVGRDNLDGAETPATPRTSDHSCPPPPPRGVRPTGRLQKEELSIPLNNAIPDLNK